MLRPRYLVALAALGLGLALPLVSCSATLPQNPVTTPTRLPQFEGTSLDGKPYRFPADILGRPTLLLVGFVQDAQFDADRWLLGLLQTKPDCRILEVPAVRGFIPGLLRDTIDGGMRQGIPEEDWASVVTVYDDAESVAKLSGTGHPRNIRVLLVDKAGEVVWFHDRGYSAGVLLRMLEVLDRLEQS